MEKPTIHLYLRHYVRDAATLERYRDIVFRVLKISPSQTLIISMVTGFNKELSSDHRYQMFLLSRNLLDRNIGVHHLPARGCGHAYLYALSQALTNTGSRKTVLCLLDADQFPFETTRFLQQLDKLASSMIREGRLMGLGVRDHISLGEESLGQLREIDEMFLALSVKKKIAYPDRKNAPIPQAYKDLGDLIPGCYCFNLSHPKLAAFIAQCLRDTQRADLFGYAGDPYITLLASMYGRMATEIMPTQDNPPGLFTLQEIENKSREFAKTSVGKLFRDCVKAERTVRMIQKYYPADAVTAVRQMLLRGLTRKG